MATPPGTIQVGSRRYTVDIRPHKVVTFPSAIGEKRAKVKLLPGHVWLQQKGAQPFQAKWPLRLHGDTPYIENPPA